MVLAAAQPSGGRQLGSVTPYLQGISQPVAGGFPMNQSPDRTPVAAPMVTRGARTGPDTNIAGGKGYGAVGIAGAGGGASQTAGTLGPGGPTPNPYNLPPDLAPNYGDAVYQDIEAAQQRAVQGNQARLQEVGTGYQQLEQDYATREQGLMQNLQGLGQVQRDDLGRQFEQEKAGLTQDMINRGIYSTTTAMQQERGLGHAQQQRQLRLEDMLTREKMDYGKALSGETLGARGQSGYLGLLERVNETGPDPNMAAQLGQMVGAGQAGTPDYLSGLGQPTGQAPSGPAPTGGTLGGPAPGDYNVGRLPQGPTSTGPPRSALPPPDFVGGDAPTAPGGTGGTSGGSTAPSTGPGGTTDTGPGVGGTTDPGGGTTPTPVPTPPSGGGGGTGGGGGGGTGGGTVGGTGGTGGAGGSGGTSPQTTDPGGDGPDVVEWKGKQYNVVAQEFYQKNIAPRVAKDPNFAWWSDSALYAMAPFPLQKRMDELRRTAAQAGRFGNDREGNTR